MNTNKTGLIALGVLGVAVAIVAIGGLSDRFTGATDKPPVTTMADKTVETASDAEPASESSNADSAEKDASQAAIAEPDKSAKGREGKVDAADNAESRVKPATKQQTAKTAKDKTGSGPSEKSADAASGEPKSDQNMKSADAGQAGTPEPAPEADTPKAAEASPPATPDVKDGDAPESADTDSGSTLRTADAETPVADGQTETEPAAVPATREAGKRAPTPGNATAESTPAERADSKTAQATPKAGDAKPKTKTKPSFDILRVEPDGSTVIAGRAEPGSRVDVMSGDDVVASSDAGEPGDFVIVLDTPLKPGNHELSLKSFDKDESAVESDEVATVSVPDKGKNKGDVLAMVTRPGEASRIVTKPEPAAPEQSAPEQTGREQIGGEQADEPLKTAGDSVAEEPERDSSSQDAAARGAAQENKATAESAETTAESAEQAPEPSAGMEAASGTGIAPKPDVRASAAPQPAVDDNGSAETEGSDKASPESVANGSTSDKRRDMAALAPQPRETETPRADPSQTQPAGSAPQVDWAVHVDAVEVEGDSIYVAGSATPGATVRIYADDAFVGETRVGREGRFVVESTMPLAVGDHTIRADLVESDSGRVVVRATVPFSRPDQTRFAAVAREAEPATDDGAAKGETGDTAANPDGSGQTRKNARQAMADGSSEESAPSPVETPSVDKKTAAPEPAPQPRDTGANDADAPVNAQMARKEPHEENAARDGTAGDEPPEDDAAERKNAVSREPSSGEPRSTAEATPEAPAKNDSDESRATASSDEKTAPGGGTSDSAAASNEPPADAGTPVTPPESETVVKKSPEAPAQTASRQSAADDDPEVGSTLPEAEEAGTTTADAGQGEETAGKAPARPPVKTVAQPALTTSDGFVIIRRGDTLWQISRRVYGQGVRYTTIYLANNEQIADPDLILPGQLFDVPTTPLGNAEELHRERLDSEKR